MTAAERQRIRDEISRRQHAQAETSKTRHRINPDTYTRILAACCPDSPIDIEQHARRIALRVAQTEKGPT